MDKQAVIDAVVVVLTQQLRETAGALAHAQAAATDEEAKPENKYDTRALEMSYVAAAQTERVEALRQALTHYHFWHPNAGLQVVAAGALVELAGQRAPPLVFLSPYGPGMTVQVEGTTVQVVTLEAPLGIALLGKAAGDVVILRAGGTVREIEIVAIDPVRISEAR